MEKTAVQHKCMSKAELAESCGVSLSTIQKWLNCRYYKELRKLGYMKDQKVLLPGQVKFIFECLVIIEED